MNEKDSSMIIGYSVSENNEEDYPKEKNPAIIIND